MRPCSDSAAVVRMRKLRLDEVNEKRTRKMTPCWTGRACRLKKLTVRQQSPGWQRSMRRWRSAPRRNCLDFLLPTAIGAICSACPGSLRPFSGQTRVVAELLERAAEAGAHGFRIDAARLAPRAGVVGGRDVVEAIFGFETVNGPGYGAVRLLREADGVARAWTISTSLDFDGICAAREAAAAATSHVRDFAGPDWLEQRQASARYDESDPDVLIVGGGHAGISVAVEAQSHRVDRAGGRPHGAGRRQLAAALSRAEAAQQDAGQSSALSAVPVDVPGVHSEGQDRELAGELCRHHGGRLLDRARRSTAPITTTRRSAGPRG